jgi:hypothetical protein
MESVIKLAIQACVVYALIRHLILMHMHSILAKSDSLSAPILLDAGFHTTATRSAHFRLRIILVGVPHTSCFWIINTSIMYPQHMPNVSRSLMRQRSNT